VEINRLLEDLAVQTRICMPSDGGSTPPMYGPLVNGFGSSVLLARLAGPLTSYSRPTVKGGHWDDLKKRKHGRGRYYVPGHLLNGKLGGPGNTWANLTPLTQLANRSGAASMSRNFEEAVKTKVREGKVVNYVVTAKYGYTHPLAGHIPSLTDSKVNGKDKPEDKRQRDRTIASIIRAEQYIPTTLNCSSHELTPDGRPGPEVKTHEVENKIDVKSIDDYEI
jgi:hypothetical protein